MLKLWTTTFGREFYIQHNGLFLFIFYMIFGAVEPGQLLSYHLSLLLAICSSAPVLAIFLLIFTLYAFKCWLFVRQKMQLPQYQFVHLSCIAAKDKQLLSWMGLYALLCAPVLLYIGLIICVALTHSFYWSILAICCYSLILLSITSLFSYRSVNYRYVSRRILIKLRLPSFKKPFWLWPVYYLFSRQTVMLLVCKVLSFLLFRGILWAFADVETDIRAYLIAMLASVLTHATLIATVVNHEQKNLSFLNSLPLSAAARLKQLLIFFVLLFIPELIMYIYVAAFNTYIILSGILFCLASLTTLRMLLYFLADDMDRYLKCIMIFFAAAMLAIIFSQFILFSLILLICSILYYRYLFYHSSL